MNLAKMSTRELLEVHAGNCEVVKLDNNLPPDKFLFGVRVFPDWRQWAEQVEAELEKRGVKYAKIAW